MTQPAFINVRQRPRNRVQMSTAHVSTTPNVSSLFIGPGGSGVRVAYAMLEQSQSAMSWSESPLPVLGFTSIVTVATDVGNYPGGQFHSDLPSYHTGRWVKIPPDKQQYLAMRQTLFPVGVVSTFVEFVS